MSRLVISFDEKRLLCKQIEIRAEHDGRRLLGASGVVEVRLTDTRLEFSCLRSSGGFVGGPVALIANVFSRRRKPSGAIEYAAIHSVYAQRKAGWRGLEVVRIVADHRGERVHVDLVLPADADATAVARDLARRDLPPWQRGQMTGVALR